MHEGVDQERKRLESRPAQQVNMRLLALSEAASQWMDHSQSQAEQERDEEFKREGGSDYESMQREFSYNV